MDRNFRVTELLPRQEVEARESLVDRNSFCDGKAWKWKVEARESLVDRNTRAEKKEIEAIMSRFKISFLVMASSWD